MSSEQVQNKIKSFAHEEYNKEEYNNLNYIQNSIDSGRDLFNRNQKYNKIEPYSR